ncbi:Fucose permease [Dyella jiangningensis]|uniref:MFS transporter n=1 Tax=Dyella sp. AtDHG13 TaxID=1938897 RepID=UPI0008921BB1|nr:MFS transporter [Dyella sp. AtDHG13]PXV59925.1 fucose permease [Dyella sp. AtDHG13]SDJ17485.1 Fucose permease [Dyella jiangningensis]
MNRFRMIVALATIYMVFAILLNSVGTVILQSIHTFGIDKPQASLLEFFKDLPIAITSFLVASFLPKLGYRRAMMLALGIVGSACMAMPLFPGFHTTEFLFTCIGVSFALTKVAVYSSIGLLTGSKAEHGRLTNTIEGLFMLGVLASGWLFSAFIDHANPANPSWFNVYWVLAALCFGTIALLWGARMDESAAHGEARLSMGQAMRDMYRLLMRTLVYVFLLSAFLYVLIEQSFSTWLPTFNNEILKLPNAMSIQMASILAGATALGRIIAGQLLRRMSWHLLLNLCVVGMGALILLVLPLAREVHVGANVNWLSAPIAAYLIPLIGLLMAPIYPVINSVALSSLPKPSHAAMTGLIVIFSALGGTLGSRITAIVFSNLGGIHAFYFSLVPMMLILVTLFFFKRETDRAALPAMIAPEGAA